uniref:Odorant-binding protein 27 n=1 Tax=Chouioia cunea TaxID=1570515 RepID=A0A6B9CKJ4_9HYME|nr:odorant-binding protein 27 [Chouioia cunea]
MKLFLALCVLMGIVNVYCEETLKLAKNIKAHNNDVADCAKRNKVDIKILDEISKTKTVPKTPEIQCFMACMMKKNNLMNEDGTLSKQFTNTKELEICKDLSGKDECEIAFKAVECFLENHLIELNKSD